MRSIKTILICLTIATLLQGFSATVEAQYVLSSTGWNPSNANLSFNNDTKTGTLLGPITGTLSFYGTGLTIDGNGQTLTSATPGSGVGITVSPGMSYSTVKGFSAITGFATGIRITSSSSTTTENCFIRNNTITGCTFGIEIFMPAGARVTRFITIDGNSITSNSRGISIAGLTNLASASGMTVTNNTIQSNTLYGLYLSYVTSSKVFHNNFVSNATQVSVVGGSSNLFNKPAPEGGNFWSDWTSPDADNNGFVDNPYTGSTPADALPWTTKDGWNAPADMQAPVTTESHPEAPASGWYTSDVPVTLTAVDYPNPGGSGVKLTEYSLNSDQNWNPFDPPFSITAEGTTAFFYRSTDNAGNVEFPKSFTVKIDKTAPVTTESLVGTAGNNGWFRSDVTVNLSATDATSGVSATQYSYDGTTWSAAPAPPITAEGTTTLHFRSIDVAGNVETPKQVTVQIDKTPPVINATRTPAPNANGWNNSDVTASYSATDAVSGVAGASTGSFVFNAEGANQSYSFTVADAAGNSATAEVKDVNIDKTAPIVSASHTPAANVNGWNNVNVTVSYTASDALSGIDPGASSLADAVLSSEGANQSATGTAVDKAGNSSAASVSGINIDKTAPTIVLSRAPEANAKGWNNSDVTVSFTATDPLSGLASEGTGSVVFTAEGAGLSHVFEVTDKADNKATANVSGVNIDKTPPSISGPSALSFGNDPGVCSRAAANVNLEVSVTDDLSGLSLSANNAPVAFLKGTTAVNWTATDNAGNISTKTQSVTINDVEPPVIVPPNSITTSVNNGKCGAVVNFAAPVVTDNCSGVSVTVEPASGSTFPVGLTVVQIKATDESGNSTSSGFAVTVVNTPPTLSLITAPLSPVAVNTEVTASATFADADPSDVHTAAWQWGDGASSDGLITQDVVSGKHVYASAGVYTIGLTVTDGCGAQAASTFQFVVVYNPEGGFVTGGGWIASPAGAYSKDPNLTGKANLGFNAKYDAGSTVPKGNNEFQLKPSLKFKGTGYEWLVISGAKAEVKGFGTINGSGNYGFLLAAADGKLGGDNVDKFRLKIWDKNNGDLVIYDNQPGAGDDADPTGVVGGGSIVIHKAESGSNSSLAKTGVAVQNDQAEDVVKVIPTEYALYNAYPNPFNPTTTIVFDLPEATNVRLVVHDMLGREIAVLANGERPAGQYTVRFDAGRFSSGMYIYRLQTAKFTQTKKLMLTK